tara:strand:- start:156 stop:323 length:168 start_codon:yes stop_codon:yes gene_type:complete
LAPSLNGGNDFVWICDPSERFGFVGFGFVGIVVIDEPVDLGLQVYERFKVATDRL